MRYLFGSDNRATAIRSLLRALIICATAFGLRLTADQVAAIQLVAEAAITAARSLYHD
jgi:hypothetical protein